MSADLVEEMLRDSMIVTDLEPGPGVAGPGGRRVVAGGIRIGRSTERNPLALPLFEAGEAAGESGRAKR